MSLCEEEEGEAEEEEEEEEEEENMEGKSMMPGFQEMHRNRHTPCSDSILWEVT